jgi:signal transduction histidine kinase
LRWRVAVTFAVCSLLVTGLLALVTWELASNYMLDQRHDSAQLQFSANSRLATTYLARHQTADPAQVLLELEYDQADVVALQIGGRWYTDGPPVDPGELNALADDLTARAGVPLPAPATAPVVLASTNTEERVVDNRPVLATAIAIPDEHARYLELATLDELNGSLRFIRTVLISGVGASLLLGLLLGRWAGWRAMRPLTQLTATAARVASGDLSARLPEQSDSDLAPLAATFNRTASALEERVAQDVRFAADVSHELRSPLTTMINATAVLNRRRAEFSDTAQHALRLLTADLKRFEQMVSDLLEISRDVPRDERELETCDLVELVTHALEIRRERAQLQIGVDRAEVAVDRRRLERVLANLLDNAARHGGGVVRIGVLRHGDRARLEVDDAGPGVPDELRPHIFQRFARGQAGDRSNSRGTGLGLALVAQHVHRYDGQVWVEDRDGGGARFVVELPLSEGAET